MFQYNVKAIIQRVNQSQTQMCPLKTILFLDKKRRGSRAPQIQLIISR